MNPTPDHFLNRRWKIVIAVGLVLFLLVAISFVMLHLQTANEVEVYKKYLRARGEKLELSEVVPPPVAPEDNSVSIVEDAFGMFGSGEDKIPYVMQMVAPGRAMIGWRQPEARGYDFTNSWDEFAAWVEADHPAIELLNQVLTRPKLDFQLDYKQGDKLQLPHLAQMKHAAMKLEAAAVLDSHNGDSGAAATNILTLLALVHKNAGEGLLISHLVRLAITGLAVPPTWEWLQVTNASDLQLAAVQHGWQQMNFLSDAENTFAMERVWSSAEIQKMRASQESFSAMVRLGPMAGSGSSPSSSGWPADWDSLTEGSRNTLGALMWRSSWSYSEEFRMLKTDQIILETVRMMQTNQSQFYKADYDAMVSRLSSLGITNAGEAFFHALKIPDFHEDFGELGVNTILRKTLQFEAARDVVMTAIALKRFHLKHGQWPETLDELVPEFLPAVPIDPYEGRPLKYHPNDDGTFLLYSVGEDGVDDGGDPTSIASGSTSFSWQYAKARDWVWPQPASSAEVQNFYEHPPK